LNVPDAHASTKERFDYTTPLKHLQNRRLESGPASLAMRRKPALHDARRDAMAKKFAGGKQPSRTRTHNEDGGGGGGAISPAEPIVECGLAVVW
jgi:hypothetical protein